MKIGEKNLGGGEGRQALLAGVAPGVGRGGPDRPIVLNYGSSAFN